MASIGHGDGEGFFLPSDAPWIVHADLATLVGGIRALLMQAMHPGSLEGVRSHSRYRQDPLGRLAGTIRWLTITTFASREVIQSEAGRVNRMHDRVKGSYQAADGSQRHYRAADPDLLLWVHVAFMESFLRCHQAYSAIPIPGGADAYVRLWARSVEPLGLSEAPHSEAELIECMARFHQQLCVTDATRDVIAWIRNPPLPPLARLMYAGLFQAAVRTMPEPLRQLAGLDTLPEPLVVPPTRLLLRLIRLAIGPESPLEQSAIDRLRRGGHWPAPHEV